MPVVELEHQGERFEIEFPEGTDRETMQRVLRERFGQPDEGGLLDTVLAGVEDAAGQVAPRFATGLDAFLNFLSQSGAELAQFSETFGGPEASEAELS